MQSSIVRSFCAKALLLVSTPAALLAATVESTINAVTVYPDRALIARGADVDLPAGESSVTLGNLPANLWDDSLQVRGAGPAGTTIIDVQSRNVFLDATPSPEIRPLEDALNALHHDRLALDDEARAFENERLVLQQITAAATTMPTEGNAPRPGLDDWRQLLAFHAENVRRLNAAQRDLARRREDLDARINAAQAQLDEARGHQVGRRAVKQVTVRLRTTAAGAGHLDIAYTVPGAQWTPVYAARLDSAARTVAFDYQAQVVNRTGEPWNQIALTLSTARPSAGGAAPEAEPWVVEQYRPRPVAMGMAMPTAAPAYGTKLESGGLALRGLAQAEDMAVAQATVDTGLTSATFRIAAPATIPADGTTQKVTVTTLSLPAGLRYDSTPKFTAAAFLAATVTNSSDFPLLAGPLAAFVDGAFIANSHLDPTMPGEEFSLALGVDDGIAIERTLTHRFVEKTGLTNSGTRVTYEVKLALTNHKAHPVTLRLAEPLPVSRHEKIVVKLLDPTERDIGTGEDKAKAFHRDDEGILTWDGSLAPGATRTLTLKFSIEHPNDLNVTGVE